MADLVRRDFGDMERWQGPSSLLADAVEQNALLRRLEEFEFETVQVDASGTIVQRATKTARHYLEPLGEGLALDMVYIPGGDFRIGAPATEEGYEPREGPQHCVDVPDFCLGRYPVTQAQWRFVAGLKPVERALKPDPSWFKGDNHPVEWVTWYDAVEFCARLSAHTGRQYRLPSEAEWEYACRAGTTTPFHFGETITTELANYYGIDSEEYTWSGFYGKGSKGVYRCTTTPVDQFDVANGFGLCDMHGNVWELCLDHWHNNYEDGPTDGSAWLADGFDVQWVIRGGSWRHAPIHCRSAYRYPDPDEVDNILDNLGFRVVCSASRAL